MMDNLFIALLNMSLTGAFVIAGICLARLLLKKAPKIISYCLWAVAGFRLIFPYSIKGNFSLIPFNAQIIPKDIAMQSLPQIDSGVDFINTAIGSILPAATPYASINPLQIWLFLGESLWLIGFAAMLLYGFISYVLLKRKMRTAILINDNIFEAEGIKSPFVLGFLHPKIYLPTFLESRELDYIILHEQTHIHRRDHIVKPAAYFILCLHWFNPLVWTAFLLMGADMEMSCDERVLKEIGGERKKDYSLSLLSVATEGRIIGGSPLTFGEGGIKKRVENVLNFKKHSQIIIIAAVILAAVVIAGFAVNQNKDIPQEEIGENEYILGGIDDQGGVLIDDDVAIYVEGRKSVHMTIMGYEAWVAAGENPKDVYDYAERVLYTPIGKDLDEQMYMRIDEYKAWAAAGEKDEDVYDFALPFNGE